MSGLIPCFGVTALALLHNDTSLAFGHTSYWPRLTSQRYLVPVAEGPPPEGGTTNGLHPPPAICLVLTEIQYSPASSILSSSSDHFFFDVLIGMVW